MTTGETLPLFRVEALGWYDPAYAVPSGLTRPGWLYDRGDAPAPFGLEKTEGTVKVGYRTPRLWKPTETGRDWLLRNNPCRNSAADRVKQACLSFPPLSKLPRRRMTARIIDRAQVQASKVLRRSYLVQGCTDTTNCTRKKENRDIPLGFTRMSVLLGLYADLHILTA